MMAISLWAMNCMTMSFHTSLGSAARQLEPLVNVDQPEPW